MKRGPRDSPPVVPRGWRSGCPVCGYHDAVRQLDAVYHDRERRRAVEPPMVNRFGLMVRGHPGLRPVPRGALRHHPPRRPSALAMSVQVGGPQVAALIGVPLGAALLLRVDTFVEFLMSLIVATLLGAMSGPLLEHARHVWTARTAEWEQAMRGWRELRYCSRCDQVFVER